MITVEQYIPEHQYHDCDACKQQKRRYVHVFIRDIHVILCFDCAAELAWKIRRCPRERDTVSHVRGTRNGRVGVRAVR